MADDQAPRPSGILPSNVDSLSTAETAPRSSGAPLGWIILAVLMFVAGVAAALIFTAPRNVQPPPQAAVATAPTLAKDAPPPQSRRAPAGIGAPVPAVNGISCDALESTIFHIHVHLAVFFDSEEQLIPFGVGIQQPWQVSDSDQGPFVDDGACFYWIHTHTQDGIIHVESPTRKAFTLGDFFAIWQQPLSAMQVGPKQGPVIVYVNGQRDATADPSDIRLIAHQRIQLNVGGDVPPYPFDFPPGD